MITCCEFYQILWTERNTFVMRQKEVVIHKAQTKCLQCSAGWKGVNINNKKKNSRCNFQTSKNCGTVQILQCVYADRWDSNIQRLWQCWEQAATLAAPSLATISGRRHASLRHRQTVDDVTTCHITHHFMYVHTYAVLHCAALCCAV